jgi:hypothetical protein
MKLAVLSAWDGYSEACDSQSASVAGMAPRLYTENWGQANGRLCGELEVEVPRSGAARVSPVSRLHTPLCQCYAFIQCYASFWAVAVST